MGAVSYQISDNQSLQRLGKLDLKVALTFCVSRSLLRGVSVTAIEKERVWIERAQAGDSGAFDALYRLHRPQIVAVITQQGSDQDSVEDQVQTTFMRAYKSLHLFRGDSAFSTWLVRIALNVCRSDYRAQQSRPSLVFTDPTTMDVDWGAGPLRPDAAFEQKERARLVREGIESLPPNYRRAVWLRYVREWSYEEITQALQVPMGTVKTWLYRARSLLAQRIRRIGLQPNP